MLTSINPVTLEVIGHYQEHSPDEIHTIISQVATAASNWAQSDIALRAVHMAKLAILLRVKTEELARLITLEMGKPIRQSRAEVLKCAAVCDYYASHAAAFLANEEIVTEASSSYIAYRPLGVVLAVMPWNFPFWQVFRFAAPALMAGNGALLKHASNVYGCALAIEQLILATGFPENLFRTLKVSGKKASAIIEHPDVSAVTLTGSVGAGRAVAAKAGSMLKKTVMELGGSDPYVILEDANLDEAVSMCVESRLINSGQSCIAAKRFIVVKSIRKAFEEQFTQVMAAKVMGDPMDENTDVGPQALTGLRDELNAQVGRSIHMGATCLLGGKVPDKTGAWYPPTILAGVEPGMPAYEEEIFGPVAAIIEAHDEQEAIRIANDSSFGLGAAVFTGNPDKGQYVAEYLINAGSCFVNDMVKSDPRLPFGGIGQSGYGRELSYLGIREFTNIKTVYVK